MPVYAIEGKLGAGKSLAAVQIIRDALVAGRRVVTNLDLFMENLLNRDSKMARVIRIPDKPTVEHLEMIGCGNESYDESKNGIIVLDELATWLNARTFADAGRQAVIDWLVHSRKKGWDVYFLVQHVDMVDKQVRTALIEYRVTCRRADRLRIPFLSTLVYYLTLGFVTLKFPRLHLAVVRYGTEANALVADRWYYRAAHLYNAYDTRQVFKSEPWAAPFSYLPPAYTHGWKQVKRYRDPKRKLDEQRRVTRLQQAGLISWDEWRGLMART